MLGMEMPDATVPAATGPRELVDDVAGCCVRVAVALVEVPDCVPDAEEVDEADVLTAACEEVADVDVGRCVVEEVEDVVREVLDVVALALAELELVVACETCDVAFLLVSSALPQPASASAAIAVKPTSRDVAGFIMSGILDADH